MYWNNQTDRLILVGDVGTVYFLQFNRAINQFTLLGSADNLGGPEGITQVNNASNEFYTIDENNYEIRKYSHNTTFNAVTKLKSWNLLLSSMPDTGNSGPEGIAFVPDSYLQKIGFVSSFTGQAYTSVKGMGGLLFLAHQEDGYVWVFDVNPNVNNDFAYVGKYKTNRSESCDLAFDTSTGLLYILHNTGDNSLEVTDLRTSIVKSEHKLNIINEYSIPNPASGSNNIEGFALSPKFPANQTLGVWLCRDVTKTAEVADAVRWFNPYDADGDNLYTNIFTTQTNNNGNVYFNFDNEVLTINEQNQSNQHYSIRIFSITGSLIVQKTNVTLPIGISTERFTNGVFTIVINDIENKSHVLRFAK